MRDQIAVVTVSGVVVPLVPRRRARGAPAAPVDVARVPLDAVRAALRIADGDPSRLRFDPDDGSVYVMNRDRPGTDRRAAR